MTDLETIKLHVSMMEDHLNKMVGTAEYLQHLVQTEEGDSDLHRKLAYYLTPNLQHWLTGAQAGNFKDLNELIARREASEEVVEQKPGHVGDGHEVVTKK